MGNRMYPDEDYDKMTGLLVARRFYTHAAYMMQQDADGKYAVLYFDIARFKMINEFCGRPEADRLLMFLARLFKEKIREGVCCHFRADIFLLCMKYYSREDLVEKVEELVEEIRQFKIGCHIMPAFGICPVDDKSIGVNIMADCARLALESIKGNYMKKYAFYTFEERAALFYEKRIENEMEKAVDNDEFEIYFQPKISTRTGLIKSCEALAAWNHPKDGRFLPERYMSIFEKNGFIIEFDTYIWKKIFGIMREWNDNGYEIIPVSIKVSQLHFKYEDFVDKFIELVREYDIRSDFIKLELYEGVFAENCENIYKALEKLQNYGFKVAVCDFGRKCASLSAIKDFSFDEVKLSGAFWENNVIGERASIVYESLADMLGKLNIRVVAEGVANNEQANFASACGCRELQGEYFYPVLSKEEFELVVYGME